MTPVVAKYLCLLSLLCETLPLLVGIQDLVNAIQHGYVPMILMIWACIDYSIP